jgi:integral membrane protein
MSAEGETTHAISGPSAQPIDPKISAALRRYRVIAYVVGIGLLALCVAIVFKYAAGDPGGVAVIGPIHGFLYMVYLALAVDLAIKDRWSIVGALGVLLAGTIPFLSFVAERFVSERVTSGESL